MKKFLFLFLSLFLIGSVTSHVSAQNPIPAATTNIADNPDGFFGQYFARMVNPCSDASLFHVVTGFQKDPFGKIICTDIRDVLKNIPLGPIIIGPNLTPIPWTNTVIQGPVASSTPDISDNASGNTLVTKKYVDENFSQVEAGVVNGIPGQIVKVNFEKKFKTAPFVIAVVENFQYEQKQEQVCWKEKYKKRWWGNHKERDVCEWRTPMVKMDLGAKVIWVNKSSATLLISPKIGGESFVSIRWLAVSAKSPFTPIFSTLTNITSNSSADEYIAQKKKESEEAMADREEELEAIDNEIKKNTVPSKAIMPFHANTCPAGWVAANGQNGTPDLRWEFIRGLDSGRGVDAGRGLGSFQKASLLTSDATDANVHGLKLSRIAADVRGSLEYLGFDFIDPTNYVNVRSTNTNFGASIWNVVNSNAPMGHFFGGARPRNVALLYCMKE